ncbi:MAG TPA: hypothetical protein VFQ76_15830, partial [Longimicrobiaceae bacterium]|nr:hypothetical protein [Longimicrobiaceae bacterium]
MGSQDYLADILTGVADALRPLDDALRSPEALAEFLADFGYHSAVTDVRQVGAAFAAVRSAFAAVEDAGEAVAALREGGGGGLDDAARAVGALASALRALAAAIGALRNRPADASLPAPFDQASFWSQLPAELVDSLLYRYLAFHQPRVFGVLAALGVARAATVDPPDDGLPAAVRRGRYLRRWLDWELLGTLAARPDRWLREAYGWGDAFDHRRFVDGLARLAEGFGFPAAPTELSPGIVAAYYGGVDRPGVLQLAAPLYWEFGGGGDEPVSLELVVAPVPSAGNAATAPAGFVLFPLLQGAASAAIPLAEGVQVLLQGGFELGGAVRAEVRPGAARVVVPPELGATVDAAARLSVEPAEPLVLLGAPESSRLEVA